MERLSGETELVEIASLYSWFGKEIPNKWENGLQNTLLCF